VIHEQTFEWKPKVKDRPRFRRQGKTIVTYTPPETIAAEEAFASQYDGPLFTQPVAVTFDFFNDRVVLRIEEVEDFSNRQLRGDTDNYLKLCGDALNTVAYADDRQIVDLRGRKN
jgi:Holliday junction resolvase RusA-like endonuclease